jgi:hypothetical protein
VGFVVAPRQHVVAHSYFSPTTDEIEVAQNALADLFLDSPKTAKLRMVYPLSDYVVRYHGDVVDGKKVIVAEGYHVSQESLTRLQEAMADPRNTIHQVFGGGALFFHYVYDVDTKQVLLFHFNAPK